MVDISLIKDIYPFPPNYFRSRGNNMHYVDVGSGEPVLMVHGNPTWSFFYRELIKAISGGRRVIAPDHLGCGLSDKPQSFPYRLETHIDNLEALVQSLDLDGITLVVHDWGAPVGMGYAVRYPKKIKSLVILNSSAFTMSHIPWRIAFLRTPWMGEFLIRRMNVFSRAAVGMAVSKPMSPKVAKGYLLPYDTYENRIAVNRFVADIPMGPDDQSYEVLLGIEHGLWMLREIPVCVMWGMADFCFTPPFLDRWLTFFPRAEVLRLPAAGHLVLEDAAEECCGFAKNFLERL